MEMVDFKEEFDYLYKPSTKKFSMISVPPMRYIMLDGEGNPETSKDFKSAVESLYSVSYSLKIVSKKVIGKNYIVPPLEALWWADDMSTFERNVKDCWRWTLMIMVPDWIDKIMIKEAIEKVSEKKPNSNLERLRVQTLREGKCVQIMYVGPYSEEGPLLESLHREYMPQHGLGFKGKHHEIYLNDARKTRPERLRTVIRQPVGKI